MSEIRLLSLWQLWASLVAAGLKRFETRSWRTDYRGLVAIHAAKRPVRRAELLAIRYAISGGGWVEMAALRQVEELCTSPLPYGAIVAVARVEDCSMVENVGGPYCWLRGGIKYAPDVLERAVGNWEAGRYAWDLRDVRPIEPIYTAGKQGFPFIREPELLEQIEQRLAETTRIEQLLEGSDHGK
jgi:hypothetical protein